MVLAEVGTMLKLSGPDVGHWFKSMCDMYGKLLLLGKSGQADDSQVLQLPGRTPEGPVIEPDTWQCKY